MNGIEKTLIVYFDGGTTEKIVFYGCDGNCAACYDDVVPCKDFEETALRTGGYLGGDPKEGVVRKEYVDPSFFDKDDAVEVLKTALDKGKGVFPLFRELLRRLEDNTL